MNDLRNRLESTFNVQGLMKTLGARLLSVADGEVQIELPFSADLTQGLGYLHAGVVTSLVDTACGYAALTRAPEGHTVVSVEFKTNFVRPAVGERFVAIGKLETAGRMLSVCRGEVLAYSGESVKTVALMQATMANVPG
ncbi:PaaI family thioesterase [Marinobacter sp.]|uniref:PaaI family thioesterase n=1 Tax=Marinobacter sp. TaxID=50741 RepID=UPI0035623D25